MKKKEPLKLGQVIDQVMKANSWDQTALGKRIGASQGMVSRMRKGEDWEQHWQIFLKLLPLAMEINVINLNELRSATDNDDQQKVQFMRDKDRKSQDGSGKNQPPIDGIMLTRNYQSLLLQ